MLFEAMLSTGLAIQKFQQSFFCFLQHGQSKEQEPTKVYYNQFQAKNETFDQENISNQLKQIENFYADIDSCNDKRNKNWKQDTAFENLYHHINGTLSVSIVAKQKA